MKEKEDTEVKIIYEDKNIIAIDKPSGLPVHGDGVNTRYTLSCWLLEKYPNIINVGEPMKSQRGEVINRPGIVHRLDKETSGVIIIAKNQDTFYFLKNQFKNRSVEKLYKAIVHGNPKNKLSEIKLPIGRSTKDPRKRAAKKSGKVRDAVTKYEVLKDYKDYSFLNVFPKTGRTHQIRVHLNSIGHPVVCDTLYSRFSCPASLGRLALHAQKLSINIPNRGRVEFESPLPQVFKKFLDNLTPL